LPVGETRRSVDFYVSAVLTRPSERRLQAGKILSFEELKDRDFPIHIGPSGRKAAGRSHTAQSRVSHTQHDTANTSRCQRPRWQSRLRLLCLPPPRKVPAAARSSLTPETRGAVPRAGLRHSVLASCLLLLLAVDASQRDAYERSLRATDHRGGKSLRKEMPQKIARPRPAAGDEEENLSARRRRGNFCHCALRTGLVHEGHGDTLALTKIPESTQQKSNHWNVSGADGQRQHVQHRSDHFIPPWAAARKR